MSKGFTLIELLVVIAIIAILVMITVLAINPVKLLKRAADTERKTDVNTLVTKLETYYLLHGSYPLTYSDYHIDTFEDSFNKDWNYSTQFPGGSWINGSTNDLGSLPRDPRNQENGFNYPNSYIYKYKTNDYAGCPGKGQWYAIYVNLENTDDPDALANKPVTWCDGTILNTSTPGLFLYPNTYIIVKHS